LEFIIDDEGEIQKQKAKGFLYAYENPTNPDEIHIHIICAEKGYGRKLMLSFLNYIREKTSYKFVSLDALLKVVGFYLKSGFTFRKNCSDEALNITPHQSAINVFFDEDSMYRNINKEHRFFYDLYKQGTLLLKKDCQNENGKNLNNLSYDEFVKKNCYKSTVRMIYCFQKGGALPSLKNFPAKPIANSYIASTKKSAKTTRRKKHRSTRTRKLRRV
jgi:hypothetical protein